MKTQTAKIPKTAFLGLALPFAALCGALFTGCLTTPEERGEENLAGLATEIHPRRTGTDAENGMELTDAGSRLSTFPAA